MARHRNVLTRAERILKLKDEERWTEQESVLGLAKVAHRKSHAGKKAAKEKTAAEGAVAGVEGAAVPGIAPAAPGAKPAAAGGAKAPAPAGAKGAAPAAKAAAPAAKPAKEAKKGK